MSLEPFEWIGHHKLLRIVTIEGALENVEPLHVGAGKKKGWEVADLIVLKVFDSKREETVPVIPGSSWKGVFRSETVALARQHGLDVCDGLPKATCLEGNEFEEIEKNAPSEESLRLKLQSIAGGNIPGLGKGPCLLCLIFGTPGLRSHVYFYDSFPLGGYRIGYRTSVAISRRTGAAAHGSLFAVEYVEPGCIFGFRFTAVNLPNYALGLISTIMKRIDLGLVKIGGLKSRGYGTVRFLYDKFKITVFGIKGVENGELVPLDPYDYGVKMSENTVEEKEAKRVLEELSSACSKSLEKLKEVSSKGWKWLET